MASANSAYSTCSFHDTPQDLIAIPKVPRGTLAEAIVTCCTVAWTKSMFLRQSLRILDVCLVVLIAPVALFITCSILVFRSGARGAQAAINQMCSRASDSQKSLFEYLDAFCNRNARFLNARGHEVGHGMLGPLRGKICSSACSR